MKPALWITILLLTASTPSFADIAPIPRPKEKVAPKPIAPTSDDKKPTKEDEKPSEQSSEESLPLALIAGIAVLGIGAWWVLRTKKNG